MFYNTRFHSWINRIAGKQWINRNLCKTSFMLVRHQGQMHRLYTHLLDFNSTWLIPKEYHRTPLLFVCLKNKDIYLLNLHHQICMLIFYCFLFVVLSSSCCTSRCSEIWSDRNRSVVQQLRQVETVRHYSMFVEIRSRFDFRPSVIDCEQIRHFSDVIRRNNQHCKPEYDLDQSRWTAFQVYRCDKEDTRESIPNELLECVFSFFEVVLQDSNAESC